MELENIVPTQEVLLDKDFDFIGNFKFSGSVGKLWTIIQILESHDSYLMIAILLLYNVFAEKCAL